MKRLALTRILLLHSSDISLHIFKSDWCFFQYAMRFCLVMEMGGIPAKARRLPHNAVFFFERANAGIFRAILF